MTMTKAEMETYRQHLLTLRGRMNGDVSHLTDEALRRTGGEASGCISNMPIHPADLGTDNFEQEFTLGLLQNQEQALTEIGDALERIRRGRLVRVRSAPRPSPRAGSRPCPTPVTASRVRGRFNNPRDGLACPH